MMLQETCAGTDAEWEDRQKTSQLEMEVCSKALAVLSSDEAHDLFTKTFNFAFIQEEESSVRRRQVLPRVQQGVLPRVGKDGCAAEESHAPQSLSGGASSGQVRRTSSSQIVMTVKPQLLSRSVTSRICSTVLIRPTLTVTLGALRTRTAFSNFER